MVKMNNKNSAKSDTTPFQQLIPNRVVIQALNDLSAYVNKSTGITHPLDRDAAIETFMILRDGREDFNPKEVKAFLISDGWAIDDAKDVAKLAQKVLDGKKLSLQYGGHYRPDILEIWRKEATGSN